jgi:hypothetical protein
MLTNEQKARWISLLLAVDSIDEYCEQTNKTFNNSLLKPIAIKHFINEKALHIQQELDENIKKKNLTNKVYLMPTVNDVKSVEKV